jgi:predicted ATPase/DNA-binding CsgD family transcriptional regulator
MAADLACGPYERDDRTVRPGGEFTMPAGTVSMLVALPGDPSPPSPPDRPLSQALAKAAQAHAGVGPPDQLAGGGAAGAAAAWFARASDAVACALALQRELTAAARPALIAVHTSPQGLDRCTALARVAWPGQVLLSQATDALVHDHRPAGTDLADLGWHRLADLGPAEHVWQLRHPELPGACPPPRSLDTYRHNLPVELTSFVRRDAELAELAALTEDARLVTLTGSGGGGKTRLALHAAAGRVGQHADGVWLAELAALRDPAQVAASVADAVQARLRGPDHGPAELAGVIGRRDLLLVLDNCEHLIGACAEVTESLLRACRRVRILATSREPLGVPGEVTWRVPSLPFPADPLLVPPEDLARFGAVQLFADRARQARPRFAVTGENAVAVAEICAQLDGIPLAIELAAARARIFSAVQIAAGLRDRFGLLTGGPRTAMPRQQTLEASVAWSYDLLAEPERAMLRQLSVFSGGFTLAAAEAVAAGKGQPSAGQAGAVLPVVSQLADKSLIVPVEDGPDDRFRMLETIRDYAAAHLLEAGQAAGAQARHFGFFARAVDRRPGEDEDAYCERLRADALAYALAVRGRVANSFPADRPAGRAALRRSIEVARQCGARHVEGIALGNLGVLSSLDGSPRDAIPLLTEALPLLREAGDVYFLSLTLIGLVQSLSLAGDYDAALVPCQELDSISGQLGAAQLYFAPCARGFAGFARGDWPEAIRSFREQLAFFAPVRMDGMWVGRLAWAEFIAGEQETARQRLDGFIASTDPARTSMALPWAVRAVIARTSGEHELAAELAQQAVAASPADPFGQITVLECLAVAAAVQADQDQHELTVRLAAAVAAAADRAGIRPSPAVRELVDPVLRASQQALGPDRFRLAWSQGQDMTLTEAVGYVTRGRGPRSRPAQGWPSLTPTERTVAAAVAEGLSNPQIAARMFISRRTVTTHLTSIFRKLGISARTELAALAARHDDRARPDR